MIFKVNEILQQNFVTQFHQNVNKNNEMCDQEFAWDIHLIELNLNMQYDIFSHYFITLIKDPYAHGEKYTEMIFSAIFKNLLSLISALDLTRKGQCGSARMIFRNVYENLIISKYIALQKDYVLLKKWEDGEDISIAKEIFRKIKYPNSEELKEFWKILCCYIHGTVYSQSIYMKFDQLKEDMDLNFVFIQMLLCMNYHVMNSYALNQSLKYYTKFALNCTEQGSYQKKI